MALKNRGTVVAPSGESYVVIRAKPMQFGEAGLSAMVKIKEAGEGDAETNPELADASFDLIRRTLERFMVSPRFFPGHPADAPEGTVTFEDLGDDAIVLFRSITSSEEGGAAAETVAMFPANPGGEAVP